MMNHLRSIYYCFFFCLIFTICGCSKKSLIEDSKQEVLPTLTVKTDSVNKIPDINTETVPDLRAASLGSTIYKSTYIDQPYIVQLADSSWVSVFTTGTGSEGSPGQHIMASRSTDLGQSWSKAVDIEPATGPVASWAIPYITSYGRIYVFYDYNGDNVAQLNGVAIKNDLLGWYCYKYSDDMGQTWSIRYRLPIKNTSADVNNNWKGAVQLFWGICKPIHTSKGLLFSYTKIGWYLDALGEGFLINCPNIETEKNVTNLQWNLLPGSSTTTVGVKNSAWNLQEEHNLVELSNGNLYMVNRTQQGFPAFSISSDFGNTWTTPVSMRYGSSTTADRIMKNPVACPRIFKCKNGNYLFWYHNNGTTMWDNRNPAWVCGGVEVNGTIWWSEPEILIYSNTVTEGFSYPDLIEQGGKYYITETQKNIARVHEISPALLNGLWYQPKRKTNITNGLKVEYTAKSTSTSVNNTLFTALSTKGGFTIDFTLKFNSLASVNQIFSNVDAKNKGVKIYSTANKTIAISLNDGTNSITWETDQGVIAENTLHHVAFVVDGAPNIITVMVDGKLCDGGTKSAFGWTRFTNINDVNTSSAIVLGSNLDGQITDFRVYSRALRTSELVSNYMANK